ncbi:sacI-like domain-containing protein [Hirsutella rhossiliensis]|uniref:SacI-like domain-containing protein n=1 Tax=Hirsutella rhossiliensis TaxID=111463 RepID=A0A9P8SLM7_9HYPO|nr:sacI-like domain-containing protein [Hirsutella rhossiliensis]KAH0967653.1 sacI-like domain-containing protein [Hirsutella rhossiliensis]
MSGIARKIVVCAAIDGLIIQPLSSKGQKPHQPVRVRYGDSSVSAVPRDQLPDTSKPESSFEAFGVIGLITVSKLSYLVTIVRRQQVAQILGFPVYVVTEVAVTPCTSQSDADESIRRTASLLGRQLSDSRSDAGRSSDEEPEPHDEILDEVEDAVTGQRDTPRPDSQRSSVAEDVIRRRGSYGRFAQSWFSQSGWTMDQRRTMGMSIAAANSGSAVADDSAATPGANPPLTEDVHVQAPVSSLLPKLLRTIKFLFGSSRSFYFSYDVDITRSLAQDALLVRRDTPLHAQTDGNFFWNRIILLPFTSTGQDSLALPLMQGFVGQRTFVVDSQPPQVDEPAAESLEMRNLPASGSRPASPPSGGVRDSLDLRPSERKYLLTLISRRSTKRAGLRYLRRGVNEEGFTANTVETEQILSSTKWDKSSPIQTNFRACKKHFESLSKTYGLLQIVNLVEKHGIEEPIGTQYQKCIERLNEGVEDAAKIPFEWFDFHQVCRGMKFENVNHLLLRLKERLEALGSTIQHEDRIMQRQRGVIRTNCMDCLDRTNVCQSSFAKHILELQLKGDGIDMSTQLDQETAWFNTLWADNGDAVSKQYASTAAMKGDYTRTRKRDYRGALNDLGLSLARFYNGMVNDHFSQAAIDFLLGNVTAKIFDEFEADMMTKDPAVSISNMRERAVELCQQRVVADMSEEAQGGWVLMSPSAADVVKSWSMDEVILLLTDAALYLCRFDWDLDKVSSFERVHLANVTQIKFGTYITSTVSPAHTDELKNVGFVVEYQPGKSNIRRTNTRTLSTRGEIAPKSSSQGGEGNSWPTGFGNFFSAKPKSPAMRKLALKAPYADSSAAVSGTSPQQTEIQQVVTICAEIERLALERQFRKQGEGAKGIVEKGEIISLEAAKRNTGLLEQLGHSIKKLVWA